jgi:DNA polymerase I-like protein with 3'-5' exonuclease and polymerase domains
VRLDGRQLPHRRLPLQPRHDALALALLNRTNISITELIGSGQGQQRTFDTVPLALATEYAAEDADVTLQLRTDDAARNCAPWA